MSRERYQELAELLVRGLSNPEIARYFGVPVDTVSTWTSRLYTWSGATSRATFVARVCDAQRDHILAALRAALFALDAGGISPEEREKLGAVAELRDRWRFPVRMPGDAVNDEEGS